MSEIERIDIGTDRGDGRDLDDGRASRARNMPQREGLPASYRMRADAHYVDQLSSRPAGNNGVDADGRPHEGPDRVHELLAEALATIQGAAALAVGDGAMVGRRMGLDLIRMQTWRAAAYLRAHAVLEGRHEVQLRSRRVGSILEQIRDGFGPECRLSGLAVQVQAPSWNTSIEADEEALVAGLTGAVIATLGLVTPAEWAVVRVAAIESVGEVRAIDVIQEEAAVSRVAAQRFFDPTWTGRPGGAAAGIGAGVARAVARLHGGEASLVVGERRGSTLRLKLGLS